MILPLHTLLVADEPVEAVLDALRRAGYDPRPDYVATPKALGAALERRAWDVVIVCQSSGGVPVWEALSWLQRQSSRIPMLVVADGLDEADVVALIEEGVRDVVRRSNLSRLGVSVARAMRNRREVHAEGGVPVDPAFHALAEHMPIGLYRTTEDGRILYANPALAQMLGRDSVADLLGEEVVSSIKYPREDFVKRIEADGEVQNLEMKWERPNGDVIFTRENTRAVRDASGALLYYEGTMEDITEEQHALRTERRRVEQLEAIVRFSAAVDAAQSGGDIHRAVIRVVEETVQADAVVLLKIVEDGFDIQAWSESISEEEVRTCSEHEVWKTYPVYTKPILMRDERSVEETRLVGPLRAYMREAGLRSLGSFPLLYRGKQLGALVALFREPHTFTEGELRIVETLSWHVAGALTRWQAERELRDSEASLRTIVETTGHVLYRHRFDADTYDHVSASIEKLTGYSARALHEAGGIQALAETARVLEGKALKEGGTRGGTETHYLALYHLRTASGELRWVEDSAYPWVDEAGDVLGLVGVLQDVTERRDREEAVYEQNRRSLTQQKALNELSMLNAEAEVVLRRVTEVAAQTTGTGRVALWLLDEEGREIRGHDLYVLAEGVHRKEPARADLVVDAVAVLDRHRVLATADLLAKPASERYDLDAYHTRNGVRAVLMAPIRQQGRGVGFVAFEHLGDPRTWTLDEQDFAGAMADLVALTLERAQRAHAEAALRRSELRYRAISELAVDYAYALRVEPEGNSSIDWATQAFERISGFTPDEVADLKGLVELVHRDDRLALKAEGERLGEGQAIEVEFRIITKSGEERWVCQRSRPVRDEDGQMRYIYSTGQDVTERKQFEAELIAAREQAEGMAQQKSEFLASMSHEIRTPLTGMLGFAGVLAEEVEGENREFVHLIERSGRRLLQTVNSVLDLARLDSDGIELAPEPLDIVDEAREAVLLLSSLAEEKGIDLRLSTDGDEVVAPLDAVCLHRILNNLVGNAIKFTDSGHVTVEVLAEGDRVRIDVWDTGVGIDKEFLPNLFDEFKQEAQGGEREGSGLGLAITKKLVEKMKGTIAVESEKGDGSRFTITFPRLIDEGRDREATVSEEAIDEEQPSAKTSDTLSPPASETAGADRAGSEPVSAAPIESYEPEEPDPGVLSFTNPFEPGDEAVVEEEAEEREAGAEREAAVDATDTPAGEDRFVVRDLMPRSVPGSGESDGDTVEAGLSLDDVSLQVLAEEQVSAVEPAGVEGEGAGDRPRVLVVEDDQETRRYLERILGEAYAVEVVAEARTALDRMAKVTYDALVLDTNLGGKQTGAGVLRVARTLPGYEHVVAVALAEDPQARDHFVEAGFNHCLSMPFAKDQLLAALQPAEMDMPAA